MQLRAAFPSPPRVTQRPHPRLSAQYPQARPMQPGGSPSCGVVQRVFAKVTVKRIDPHGPHATAINAFIESLKGSIDRAYQYVLQNPGLGVLAQLDGHTSHWVGLWNGYLSSGASQLTAAAFGYVIESLVSINGSPYRATPPGGYDLVFQVAKGGTRPDIVLSHNGAEVAWFDLTASDSPLHIFTQKVGWSAQSNVAEITYPSTNISMLNKVSASVSADFDVATIDREIRFQRYNQEQLRQRFWEMGQDLKKIFSGKKPSQREAGGDALCRGWTKQQLKSKGPFKGHDLTDQQVTAILYALDLNPTTYGFYNSVSQSVGEHLLKIILGIPQVSAPKQTVPVGPPGFGLWAVPQPLAPPRPFQPESHALVPVQPPPRFNFTSPSFGNFGSFFGGGNNFVPQFPSGFSFSSPSFSQPPVDSQALVTSSPKKFGRGVGQIRRLRIRKADRFNPGGAPRAFTIRMLVTDLVGEGITLDHITRAALRYRDPLTGQTRTVVFARSGYRTSTRPRPVYSFSARSTGLSLNGPTPQFTAPPLLLPNAPTPLSQVFASLFGNGSGGGGASLASATVEMAVVEYDDGTES